MALKYLLAALFLLASFNPVFSQTLKEALANNDTVAARELVKKGAEVNALDNSGVSLLMNACRWANETSVRFLLANGATPDKPRSAKGRTALMVACAYYSGQGICSMLIAHGADVNTVADGGVTALMLAAQNAKLDVVALLLKNGAKAGMKDSGGKTALDHATTAEITDYIRNAVKDTRIDKDGVVALLKAATK